ncbi:alpha/beta fold hydrolase [Parashewanella curva]|uniref:Alpha/beta fold hydrolase n=1 Tax=Parashewanella curva TaxID=2338552 RepID=A0A3L8PUL1_9GAMM|nr:alpha/beta fold hydrolase [Parashewanella curva]RLV59107.1 alpha/beta fold hydrolase [Parashewanella curva]
MQLWMLKSARLMKVNKSQWAALLFIGLVQSALSVAAQANLTNTTGEQSSCYLKGLSEKVLCGMVTVPENPNKPNARNIDIHYAILPAIKNQHPSEAFVAIAGGPGQSAIDNAAGFNRTFSKIRETRDILLIDQRGTGRSNILNCEFDNIDALAFNDETVDNQKETQKCLSDLSKKADVTQYSSDIAVSDFEAVRKALGYQKFHLYGISYGSRMAQLYMRHYTQSLATVTLDGVVPMQQSVLAIGEAIDRSVELLFQDCRQSKACDQAFPELKRDYLTTSKRLHDQPYQGKVNDPSTGEPTHLLLTKSKFLGTIRMGLYSSNIRSLLPYAIHQANKGNYQSILGLYSITQSGLDLAMGMHASVVCGEDLPRLTPELKAKADASYFGRSLLQVIEQTCPVWNMPAVKASFSHAIDSAIPTLLLSGELDPATPPSWGHLAEEKLTHAKHFIAPYATHGVALQSCGNKLVAQLVNEGNVDKLDDKCLKKDLRRSFYLNASSVEPLPAKAKE